MDTYKLLNDLPKIRTEHNRVTWEKVVALFAANRPAFPSFDQLLRACREHDHPAGAKGFVSYCIRNGWIGLK